MHPVFSWEHQLTVFVLLLLLYTKNNNVTLRFLWVLTLHLLQNSELLRSSSPDLTDCFQQAILAWLPCLFLMTFGSTYLVFARYHISETPNKNGLSLIGWIQTVRLIKLEYIWSISVQCHILTIAQCKTDITLTLFRLTLRSGVWSSCPRNPGILKWWRHMLLPWETPKNVRSHLRGSHYQSKWQTIILLNACARIRFAW